MDRRASPDHGQEARPTDDWGGTLAEEDTQMCGSYGDRELGHDRARKRLPWDLGSSLLLEASKKSLEEHSGGPHKCVGTLRH